MNGLYLRTLHLNNQIDYGNQQQRFPINGRRTTALLASVLPTVRHEMQEKAERHQGKHFPITHYQLREKPGTESRKYLPQHIQRSGEIGIAEEYPAEANEVERMTIPKKRRMPRLRSPFFRPVTPIQNLWTAKATPCNMPQNTKFQEAHATSRPETW